LRMAQKVKPNIQLSHQVRRRLGEFRQLQDVQLQISRKWEMMPLFEQPKVQVMVRRLGKEHMVQETDRYGRLELEVVLAFVELLLMKPAGVVENPLLIISKSQHLHFNIEMPAGLVAGLDVQDGQLVIQGFLGIERIEQLQVLDAVCERRHEHAVQEADENGAGAVPTEEMLEGVINGGSDSEYHGSLPRLKLHSQENV